MPVYACVYIYTHTHIFGYVYAYTLIYIYFLIVPSFPTSADDVHINLCLSPHSFNKSMKCPVATGTCAVSPLRSVQLQEELRSSCFCRWG